VLKLKKIIFLFLGLLVISMFLISCAPKEDQISDLELQAGLEELNDEELESIIAEGEVEESKALAGQASHWRKPVMVRNKKVPMARAVRNAKQIYNLRKSHKITNPKPTLKKPIQKKIFTEPAITEAQIIKDAVSIASKTAATNWEEQSAVYDIYYYEEDPNIRIVCQQPCPISDDILEKKLKGAQTAISNLLGLTEVDVVSSLQPVDIHLTSDIECGNYQEKLAQYGYVSRSSGGRPENIGGSFMCLWEWDDENLVLPLNEENAERLEAQSVLVHEYGHILFYRRSFASPEHFVKSLQFYVSGLWDGNGLEPTNFPLLTDACDPNQDEFSSEVYNLCTNCGFQMADFSTLLEEIDLLYQNSEGEEDVGGLKPKVSVPQMKSIIDQITGYDSVSDCNVAWLGDPCSNC